MSETEAELRRPKVSVVIPNYNHSGFLEQRIASILGQTFQDFEIIFLDDASTDDSMAVFARFSKEPRVKKVIVNEVNSGSPFKQWNRGVREASGEYIWIAESDDYADPDFLRRLVAVMDGNPGVGIVYCGSIKVDEKCNIIGDTQEWTSALDKNRWCKDFINNGSDECLRSLIYKCIIPNVSAALIRRSVYVRAGCAEESMRFCGDYLTYVKMLAISDLAYIAEPLNYFRFSSTTVRAKMSCSWVHEYERAEVIAYISKRFSAPQALRESASDAFIAQLIRSSLNKKKTAASFLTKSIKMRRAMKQFCPHFELKLISTFVSMVWQKVCKTLTEEVMQPLQKNYNYFSPFAERIGYIGWLGHGNLGDEAMFLAFKKIFPAFSVLPFKSSKKMATLESLTPKRLYKAVFLGGGTFIYSDAIRGLRQAQKEKRPTFVFGAGAMDPALLGTIEQRPTAFTKTAEWVDCLNLCRYVGVRGPLSKAMLENEGYRNAQVIGDLALSLSKDTFEIKEKTKKLGINIGRHDPYPAGQMYGDQEKFLEFIVQFAKTMREKKWEITFYPVFERDRECVQTAARKIGGEVLIFSEYHSVPQMLNSLKGCDLFVGEKLHSTVLAMCAHVPSIMLEYRPKCLDFMTSMDLEKFNMRTDRLSLDKAMGLVDELYNDSEYYRKKIAQKAAFYKKIQKEKALELSRIILEKD